MKQLPSLLVSDRAGNLFDIPDTEMAGKSGRTIHPVQAHDLIPLPGGSQVFMMPERSAIGFDRRTGRRKNFKDYFAVAAYIPPSYTHLAMAAYGMTERAPRLPLMSFTAVGWYRGRMYVPAVHIDREIKHLPTSFDDNIVSNKVEAMVSKYPHNRLIAHHGRQCAVEYGCANAKNFFLQRWEAPIAVAGGCNANCIACISFQPSSSVPSPQERIPFLPTVEEIVEMAVVHLITAPKAIVSFGQGCEGEPLLQGPRIEKALREIRRQTRKGVLHLNTNGSRPTVLAKLFDAGLDSVRISLNSVQPELYHRYYKPNNYSFEDVRESLRVARTMNKYTSMNYFVFPGITDSKKEAAALMRLFRTARPNLIQWRNFNIDPEWYLTEVCHDYRSPRLGVKKLMFLIQKKFPDIQFGYNNKAASVIHKSKEAA